MSDGDVAYRRISREIRNRILTGVFKPGELLPSRDKLAQEFGTSEFTMHKALTPLVEEGLVTRKRRVGTIVQHNPAVLTCAGIYCGSNLLDGWQFAFYRELCRQLQTQLTEQGVRTEVFLDSRTSGEQREPLPALARTIEKNEIQGLLVPLSGSGNLTWLARLPVAASFVSSAPIPNRVTSDLAQMWRLALSQLRERGCRTVGVIDSYQRLGPTIDREHDSYRFFEQLVEALGESGLTTHNAWQRSPATWAPNPEAFGYAEFHALWAQADRPDAVVVYPDTVARGVMTAVLELGVRVPQDVKLVFHRNRGVDWTCPAAVDWVETDVAAWAAAMIEQVRQQKNGQNVAPVRLPYRLVPDGVVAK